MEIKLTSEDFIKDANEDELFCLFGEFFARARGLGYLGMDNMVDTRLNKEPVGKTLLMTDKQVITVVREMQTNIKNQVWLR